MRKHLPSMEAVVEESSQYEQSVLSIISPKDINSLENSRRAVPSQIFNFEEFDIEIDD